MAVKQKPELDINEFRCKIIKMNCFNIDKTNELIYYLLVDEDGFILDYKFQFKKICLKKWTTRSHIDSKKDNLSLIVRKQILHILGERHNFVPEGMERKKKPQTALIENPENVNLWLKDFPNFHKITFQNIEYIITGSNPSGQGNGKGYLNISWDNKFVPFGFFISSINFSKKFFASYSDCTEKIQQLWSNAQNDIVDFDKWMKYDKLKLSDYFYRYLETPNDWENIQEDFKKHLTPKLKTYEDVKSKIQEMRVKQKQNIQARWGNNQANIYKQFFNIENKKRAFEHAHIKPVWLIKQEYNQAELKIQKEKIIEQIADENNFLPLTPNVHTDFDKKMFYWDHKTGKLIFKDKNIVDDLEVNDFKQINQLVFDKVSKYLKDYYEQVINKNN